MHSRASASPAYSGQQSPSETKVHHHHNVYVGGSAVDKIKQNPWKYVSFILMGLIVFHFLTLPGSHSPTNHIAHYDSSSATHIRSASGSNGKKSKVWWQDHVRALADPEPVQVVLPSKRDFEALGDDAPFEEREKLRAREQRIKGAETFSKFRPGKDFFVDYDVSKVKPPQQWTKKGPHEFDYVNQSTSPYFLRYVSEKPRIAVVPNFLSDEECDALVDAAEKKLFRSQVAIRKGDANKNPINEVRTSSQAWLNINEQPADKITERIFALTGWKKAQSEQLQILRYEKGQKYDAHEDFFDPRLYGPQTSNRALTAYLYLSDVPSGGETWFPMADGKGNPRDFVSCDVGLGFKPHKGTVVLFYGMFPDAKLDHASLHGSCPVKEGVKWGGTLWLRVPTP